MKETKLFELVTGTEMKPWLSRNMLPNINTRENFIFEFLTKISESLKLLELTQFAWPNLSIYLNFIFLIRLFLTSTSGTKPIIVSAGHVCILLHQREKWGSTIQYGYRKRGTHTRVFSQTLTHGNSKNEIRQWNRRRRTEERREYGKTYSGHE